MKSRKEEERRRKRRRGELERRKAQRAQLAREPETTVSLFMGFTGVRSTARAAEGTAPLRTRAWQVLLPSVNHGEGVTVYYLAANLSDRPPEHTFAYIVGPRSHSPAPSSPPETMG